MCEAHVSFEMSQRNAASSLTYNYRSSIQYLTTLTYTIIVNNYFIR